MGMFDDLPDLPASGAPASVKRGMFDDLPDLPSTGQTLTRYAEDAARSVASGAARGAVGLAGVPELLKRGPSVLVEKITGVPAEKRLKSYLPEALQNPPSSEEVISAASRAGVPGLDYQPQTKLGEYARTVGEFLPASVVGPGGAAPNALRFGVAPGLASEAAGQATKGTSLEPYARAGAALVTGGASALAGRPGVAAREVAKGLEGVSPQQLAAAEALMRDAEAIGLPLTRAEAIQQVTQGATRLADLQRIVEGQGGLRGFMAQRPEQIEAAGRQAVEQIAPVTAQPSVVGPQIQQAAEGTISDVTAAINRHTRPLYQAAETQSVGPAAAQLAANEPLYAQTLQEIRSNPALNRPIANLPDDSPVVMDMVRQRLRERADAATSIGQATPSNLEAASYGAVERQAGQESTAASPELAHARAQQAQLRQQYLEPLTAGPLGKLSKIKEVSQAAEALFPRNPVPNSAGEILTTVQALSKRNPWAARQLVRAHVESVFNNATRDLQAGPSGFGGASFRSQLVGNKQQAENLTAGIRGLPGGDAILPGFDRMLEVMEATGQRQRIGSQTAFNQELQAQLKSGGITGEVTTLAAGGGLKLPARIKEKFEGWRLGKNVDEIARLLTDPQAADAFRALADAPNGSQRMIGAIARLYSISQRASNRESGGKTPK